MPGRERRDQPVMLLLTNRSIPSSEVVAGRRQRGRARPRHHPTGELRPRRHNAIRGSRNPPAGRRLWPGGRALRGFGMLATMGPTRTEILSALALVGVLVFLMLVLVVWAIPPGGPPALQ